MTLLRSILTNFNNEKANIKGADPEDRDEYKAENIFFVPVNAGGHFYRLTPNSQILVLCGHEGNCFEYIQSSDGKNCPKQGNSG
jgi:hypothetical protein